MTAVIEPTAKIYVAGHAGMVGSAMVRILKKHGYSNMLVRTSRELDLTRQHEVEAFLLAERPACVIVAAAHVGGILANATYRAQFITLNLQIQTNVIDAAWKAGVEQLLFFSSSCVYPRACPQPMKEEHLWSGPLEPTNEPYAVAKLAGMSMCRAYNEQYGTRFLSVIPTNLYGPNDNFHPEHSHVMAALIRNFHAAKVSGSPSVTLWGTGTPKRELMYVDDAAEAALMVLGAHTGNDPVNVGTGQDQTIRELAQLVKETIGYAGDVEFDATKPDGAPRKILDASRILALGWTPQVSLEQGIAATYRAYLKTMSV